MREHAYVGGVNGAPLLEVRGLQMGFMEGGRLLPAVDDLSFSVRAGETFALLGESGCGKSMTALSILRLLPDAAKITRGEVLFQGRELLSLPEFKMREVRGGKIAMIFQEPATSLNPVLTVETQIAEVLKQHAGLFGKPLEARALDLLKEVSIPDPKRRLREYPFQFSGGMKQRLMIALALAGHPQLLIADEPTTALDVTIQAEILALLRKIQSERDMGIFLITHDLGVVHQMADRVAVMYAGEIVEEATRSAFFENPQHPYTQKLFASLPHLSARGRALETIPGQVPPLSHVALGCRFVNRCEQALPRCSIEAPAFYQRSPTHRVRCHLMHQGLPSVPRDSNVDSIVVQNFTPQSSLPLLRVQGLRAHFPIQGGLLKRTLGHVHAVDGVSFDLFPGKTLALVGESGCGKTTVGKAILQLVKPTAGEVLLGEANLATLSRQALRGVRRQIQMVFQDPFASLNPRLTINEIILEGMRSLGAPGLEGADRDALNKAVVALLNEVGLSQDALWRYPHEFSGGQRQRIAIARALAVQPDILICDEPTSALDVSVQAQILNLLKSLQERLGLAYLFITHNFAVVEYLAHEIAVMYLGRIVEYGDVDAVLRTPRHPYTQALLSAVPTMDSDSIEKRIRLSGEMPSPVHPPSGCYFHPRCPHARDICRDVYPSVSHLDETHRVSCHYAIGWHQEGLSAGHSAS